MDPLQLFKSWFLEEKEINSMKLPAACCLSTIGEDGYPNARFVSLKELRNESFVITGSLDSRKGRELQNINKAALTFWWTGTERHIRIQGDVTMIPDAEASQYFSKRNVDSRIVSNAFDQGMEIESIAHLKEVFETKKNNIGEGEPQRPVAWGGFYLKPIRIELMQFKASRLHERRLFSKVDSAWEMVILQP